MSDENEIPLQQLRHRALGCAEDGNWEAAIQAWERLLQLGGEDADARVQLSYAWSLAGSYRAARDNAVRAADAVALKRKVLLELLPRLRTFNEIPLLLRCIDKMGPLSSVPIPVLLRAASQLSNAALPEKALVLLDEARRGDPEYPATLLARAQVLMYCGRMDEARADVERALRRAPSIAHGYWLQAALRRQTQDTNHVDAIRKQLASGRSVGDLALLNFALHKELDDLGDHSGAWIALEHGCQAKRSMLRYRLDENRRLLEDLLAAPIPAPARQREGAEVIPIFIVGMHRSGTTLLEHILDRSKRVKGIGELYDFTSAMRWATDHHCRGVIDRTIVARSSKVFYSEVGRRYLDGMRWRLSGESLFTDKLPSNFLNVGFIAAAQPEARILHMVRDPVETCFSNLRELFSDANPYSYDQTELADYHAGYRMLMQHWHANLPGHILDVDYARLTREPEVVMREVCRFCGIEFHPDMLRTGGEQRGVVTASAVQVRDAIQVRDQPKWKPYERYLGRLLGALPKA